MNPLNLIPPQYRLLALGAAAIALALGGYFYGSAHEARIWRAAIAEQKAEAAAILTAATEAARKKEAEDADKAREIDADHFAALAAANAGRDAFAERLRVARRGAGSCGAPAGQAADPGFGAGTAESGNDGPGSPDPGNRLRDAALELQAYAKACHAFALEAGRY